MKKLSLMSLLESDILNQNQELKNAVVKELPGYVQAFMSQIKMDKYQEAMVTLDAIIDTCKKIQQEMSHVLNKQTM